ncbi:tail completion protein gp17 [Novosphingopyxis sp.]|uniref:tail completion protein gp17 n=1 Tax=Novosphingopyxis sp. TaxID=2709690 RepID=UPI003B5A37B2
MSAATVLRAAALAALRADPLLGEQANGVYGRVPPGAQPPFLSVPDIASVDWSTKTARGRELRLAVLIEVDQADPSPLGPLADAAETAILALPRDLPGWRVASIVYGRELASDEGKRRRRLIEFRARVLAT